MITAIWGAVALVIAIVGGVAGHWLGARKVDTEVAKAKTVTEATTRAAVAQETAVAAGDAMKAAADTRTSSVSQAQAIADQGRQALIDAMKKDGEIQ